jgi:hypothetical protein
MPRRKHSRIFRTGAVLGAGLAMYHLVIRPWQLCWGATQAEIGRVWPGDELVPHPCQVTTRAITIRATPADIWPWIVQIGYGRGGFYSYDWLENLSGLDIISQDEIVPKYQDLALGDKVHIAPETPLTVTTLEPNRAVVLHNVMNPFTAELVHLEDREPGPYLNWSWAFLLNELEDRSTRLVVRVRVDYQPRWLAPSAYALLEPVHFIMERKMLLGIKERAQRGSRLAAFDT